MLANQNNLDRRLNPTKTESDIKYDKWLGTTSMDDLSKELDKARANNDTGWIRRIQQYSGKNTDDIDAYKNQANIQNSELNLGRSAATTLRDVNDTKTYDSIDVNDSNNIRYFSRQNLLKKTLKSALGDNADVSRMSYQDVINAYNNASGDQQADIKKAIADEIVDQRELAKKGNQESLKSVKDLADLNSLLNEYGTYKGKSFGKQITDFPYDIENGIEPVYVELPGWKTDMTSITSESEFPEAFRQYISFLEEQLETPIKIVSVGPDREQTIVRQ